ncbi:MAG: DUF2845 domain-containing protein [Deltaproteobacteria bacterium]|nr:DUF2845 domain-containing protein [Deltaproteobacteria bacterium]
MKQRILIIILVLLEIIILWTANDCFAFRCGNEIVGVGDTKGMVRLKCGAPDIIDIDRMEKQGGYNRSGQFFSGSYGEVIRSLENWYYDCGTSDFIYKLTFEGDRLIIEDSVGRGKSSASGCLDAQEKRSREKNRQESRQAEKDKEIKSKLDRLEKKIDSMNHTPQSAKDSDKNDSKIKIYKSEDGTEVIRNY